MKRQDIERLIDLQLISTPEQRNIARNIVEKHHSYVPTMNSVGRRIDWLIYYDYQVIGMIGIGSSVYPPPKDLLRYLGVSKDEYKSIFNQIANNWRFCMSVSVKNAGTQILKILRNDAPLEWKKKYGDELTHIITFVGADKNGAVYKADNWQHIGYTAGLPKHKSSSMKWDSNEQLKQKFVKPTGENKKMIFVKPVKLSKSKERQRMGFRDTEGLACQTKGDSMKRQEIEQLLDKLDDKLMGRQEETNFPEQGDDEKVSLRNSNYDRFPVEEAQDLKDNFLSIWREGGNIRGNRQFELLAPIARRGGNVETLAEENAVRRREAWAARHFEDYSLAGVVAQIKWLVVGSRGLDHMRAVIREAKQKLKTRSNVRVTPLAGQSKDEFLSYCMGSAEMNSEFPDPDQRYAVCLNFWKGKKIEPNPCWEGYEAIGLKPNGDPNCVPMED